MPPSDLSLCERLVSCFQSRLADLLESKFRTTHRFFMNEQEFYDANLLTPADISGSLVIVLAGFGVRCHKWKLCYENGMNDGKEDFSIHAPKIHKPRLFYEIELSKPSGYVFQRKHRNILSRQGFRPVDEKAFKPWTRITTRVGVVFEEARLDYPTSFQMVIGNGTPHQLYHKSGRPFSVYDVSVGH